jgi:hypothetical protein
VPWPNHGLFKARIMVAQFGGGNKAVRDSM